MRFLALLITIFGLCVLSHAYTLNRVMEKYVDVHEIDTNTLTPLQQLPPQDPANHSFPTVPSVPLVPTCTKEGYFRDPFNCRKFYYCQDANAIPAGFYCQSNLIFNTITNSCDHNDHDYVQC